MDQISAFILRLLRALEWRKIATAPFDREIELANIDDDVDLLDRLCVRHVDGWRDAQTLKPITVRATHWRHRRPAALPTCCC